MEQKRVLIISSNPLSIVENNGKTIASLFDNYPKELLAQLYFSANLPCSDVCRNYFQISDMDILRVALKKNKECGRRVDTIAEASKVQTNDSRSTNKVSKGNFSRLCREFIWGNRWKTQQLQDWLDQFSPQVIFFVGGDVVFAYKICSYVQKRYSAKLGLYITDDYILPRRNFSPFWWLRRNNVLRVMRECVDFCDAFFTISPAMRNTYMEIFHKDSMIISHMFGATQERSNDNLSETDKIKLVYAGGLHLRRIDVLIQLANAIASINKSGKFDKQLLLEVYSGQTVTVEQRTKIETTGNVWGGMLVGESLVHKLEEADYLVHVESFDYKNMCNTRLSLSTKIPEYMSYRKPIIAIGPKEIASMQYLEGCAYCITSYGEIEEKLKQILIDVDGKEKLVKKAYKKYCENHTKEKKQKEFIDRLNDL